MYIIFSEEKIPSQKRQDKLPLENGDDTDSSKDTKAAKDSDADPSANPGTSEDGDSSDYEYEDEDSTELEKKTCLGGLPKEYCAAIVQILFFIGLFIGGFIPLR